MVINSMFVHHFVDPDLRIETFFEKEGTAENEGVDFEIEHIGTSAHLYWRLKKISCRACLLLYLFIFFWGGVKKKKFLKALLTYNFIPSFLNSFDLPSYSSESRKR